MKKNKMKFIKCLIVFVVFFALVCNFTGTFSYADSIIDTKTYTPTPEKTPQEIKDIVNNVISILRIIGSIISVATLGIIGIKYMLGSVQEKAEYKKVMMPYIIGAILVFATTNILKIVYDFAITL